ncbi:hypothetical protein BVX99_02460, partial [bacterium F16]
KGNYSDVVSVLKSRAGLHFRSFSGSQEATVDIRGFGENSFGRVLVLSNGRKLNRPDMRGINWSQIPLANIERIEVIRGPNGAVYGDSAVGGVINIITKRGSEEPHGELVIETGSNKSNRLALSTYGASGRFDYGLALEHTETAGWRDRTGSRTKSGDIKLGYELNDIFRLELGLMALRTDYELPGSLTKAVYNESPKRAGNYADEATENYFGITPSLIAEIGDQGEFTLDLGYLEKFIETDMTSWSSWTDRLLKTLTVSPRYIHRYPIFGLENRFIFGADWTEERIDLERFSDARRTIYGGGAIVDKNTLAIYANNSLHINANFILSLGMRWAESTFKIDEENGASTTIQKDEHTHREKAYHIGLTHNVTDETKIFTKYEQFFRLPFLDEQISFNGFGSSFNKELRPETGESYELGIEQHLAENTDITLTLFRMMMTDEIAYVFPNNVNLDETLHQGAELSFTSAPTSTLDMYLNYTWTEAEFDKGANSGNRIPLVPEHKVALGAEWQFLTAFRVNADVIYTSEMYQGGDNANTNEKMDQYTVVDLGTAYSCNILGKTAEIYAKVNNVFDERYTDFVFFGGYYTAPGRTYNLGMKWRF